MSHLVSEYALEWGFECFQLTISKGDEAHDVMISVHLPFSYSTTFKLSSQFQTLAVKGSKT